jgi:ribose 5-phosphate isomerase B
VGIGSSIAANKIAGVRCAVCHDVATVLNSREHNDANVLSLGERLTAPDEARRIVNLFLDTPFAGGRHERRVKKIDALDQ